MSGEIIVYPHCGRKNRTPAAATGVPRCGNRQKPLRMTTPVPDPYLSLVRPVVPQPPDETHV
jgi:hypothetical protein